MSHWTDEMICTPKRLPPELEIAAAKTACELNPSNRPWRGLLANLMPRCLSETVLPPARLAVVTSRYWGKQGVRLTVSFLDTPAADLRARILAHMNAWGESANVRFAETAGVGQVRIARGPGGYWSYIGTDILQIPARQPTMNLEGFTMRTPDSEFARVVRHETGHTLGFPHEHMRRDLVALLDAERTIAYFASTQRWTRAEVIRQVLTPLDEASLLGTPPDATSIMCYQIPGVCTRDGRPILGGNDINATDRAFAARIYRPPTPVPPPPRPTPQPDDGADDWGDGIDRYVRVYDAQGKVQATYAARRVDKIPGE